MPIFYKDKKRILYIHIPKTGGSTVEKFFKINDFRTEYLDAGDDPALLNTVRICSPQHMHLSMLETIFNLDKFDYIFGTVRHPISRFKSEYLMRVSSKNPKPAITQWADTVLAKYAENPFVLDNHLRPQSDFIPEGCEIFRQEDRYNAKWAEQLEERIGLTFDIKTPQAANVRRAKHGLHIDDIDITLKLKARLKKFYKKDFERFGYE